MAFDDRELEKDADGNFEFTYVAEPGAKTMIVREVFNDWDTEERGTLTIERPDTIGQPAKPLQQRTLAQQLRGGRPSLVGSIQTWFAFPHFFQYKEPVNTLTAPQSTPGGLASQRSSIGHYELADDEAMVVTVPECTDCAYQGDPDRLGLVRLDRLRDPPDLAHQGPGRHRPRRQDAVRDLREQPGGTPIANWLETTGHRTGAMMLRWQRLKRDLDPGGDGPVAEIVPLADVPARLPHFTPITTEEYAERIAARQRSVARRMIS